MIKPDRVLRRGGDAIGNGGRQPLHYRSDGAIRPWVSMPIPSFTADRMRCLHPRYRSGVWIETWPSRNCICSSSPPAEWHRRAQVLLRLCGASLLIAAFAANSRTTCQTTFSVMFSPQTHPALFTRRNSLPEVISRAGQPNVKVLFNPVRHRHRSYVTALSDEIDNGPMLFPLLQMGEAQLHGFVPPQAAGEQHSQKGAVPFALQSVRIGRLPKGFALFGCQPVSQAHSEFLDALHSPDTSGKIRAKKTAIGGFVCESAHGTKAQIHGSRCELPGLEVHAIADDNGSAER
jgi:hypothetical protein